ncbi:DUF4862 family protein [Actinomycetaceae bacterium TAE3-ERU4]|nr:DUF4862 family protein [Actinomycetaceae bacterium TAE3-ERU4]
MTVPFIVGAYAAMPAPEEQAEFYSQLAAQEWVNGLEIPYPAVLATAPQELAKSISSEWNFCTVTAIPGTMQQAGLNDKYGLASPDSEGRKLALDFTRGIAESVSRLHDACGRSVIKRVQLHSAPCQIGRPDAFAESLGQACEFDWSDAKLVIEHCDKYIPGQSPEKGYLSLEDEIKVAQQTGINLHLNWGRSVLEGRQAQTGLEQTKIAVDAGVLEGYIFSGAGPEETQYGHSWADGHMPAYPDEPTSLLTEGIIREVSDAAQEGNSLLKYLGAKICVPKQASVSERVALIKRIYQATGL